MLKKNNNSHTLSTHVRREYKQNSAASRQTIKSYIILSSTVHKESIFTYKCGTCANEIHPLGITPHEGYGLLLEDEGCIEAWEQIWP